MIDLRIGARPRVMLARKTRAPSHAETQAHAVSRCYRLLAALAVLTALVGAMGAASAIAAPDTSAPQSTALERTHVLVQPAVVSIDTTWSARIYDTYNKRYVSTNPITVNFACSGFLATPNGHIITAGHCAQYDDGIRAALMERAVRYAARHGYYLHTRDAAVIRRWATTDWRVRQPRRAIAVTYSVAAAGLGGSRTQPARLLGLRTSGTGGAQEEGDVALLKIDGENLPTLPIAAGGPMDVGTRVVSVGYPASVDAVTDPTLDASFKDGTISSVKTMDGGLLPVYEVSAAVSAGMSGGPTVDLHGRVIGVNSFGIVGETQPFNFIRPASLISELLNDKGIRSNIGAVNVAYRDGVEAYFHGDRSRALKKLRQVLAVAPTYPLAEDYRAKASRLRVAQPASDAGLGMIATVGALLIVLAAGGLLLELGRRRRRRGSSDAVGYPPADGMLGPDPDTKVCVQCAEAVKDAARVCHYCGHRFTGGAEHAQAA